MFILARGGKCYARLRYNVGPGVDVELPVDVDYGRPFEASDWELWYDEYLANVQVPPPEPLKDPKTEKQPTLSVKQEDDDFIDDWWRDAWGEYADFDHYRTGGFNMTDRYLMIALPDSRTWCRPSGLPSSASP